METQGLLKSPRFIASAWVAGGLTAIILIFTIFVIGGKDVYSIVTNVAPTATVLTASFLFARALADEKNSVTRRLWHGMAIGLFLWGLADAIWMVYEVFLRLPVPYPSIADFFWIIGYIPLYAALINRLMHLQVKPTAPQTWVILAFSAAWLVISMVFVIWPNITSFNPETALESLLNIAYPLFDLGLMILSTLLMVLMQKGRFAWSWRLISAGVFIMGVSDMFYSYGVFTEQYLANDTINAVTIAVDSTYIIAYVCVAFGIYIYGLIKDIKDSFILSLETATAAKYHALICTDQTNRVVSTSDNFAYLFKEITPGRPVDYHGLPLARVLGIEQQAVDSFMERTFKESLCRNEPFSLTRLNGDPQDVLLTALATYNANQGFDGANIALVATADVPDELRFPRNKEVLGILNYLLSQGGILSQEENQSMKVYFLDTVKLLSSLLFQFGGERYRNELFTEMNQVVQANHYPVKIANSVITISEELEGKDLAQMLNQLLAAARHYACLVLGDQLVAEELKEFDSQITPTMVKYLEKHGMK